jgi:alkylation response protein AidB-like acyl-CoA dehydrogenase
MSNHTPYFQFYQPSPTLDNQYTSDEFLVEFLTAYLPSEVFKDVDKDLTNFGKRCAEEFLVWARDAEINPPKLNQYDVFGKRIDEIKVSEGWTKLERVAAEEGLVSIGYERVYGQFSRLYQFAKLYLYAPSSAIYICPLAMTDGAARLIELFGDNELKETAFRGLTSRNPNEFLTSGQWMTERTGGSDVSRSMTFAAKTNEGYQLFGHKWFTSAITANMAFTLASTAMPEDGKRTPLSLFYLPIRNEDNSLNHIEVEALKDKLGTKALPTAQLELKGTKAKMVGEINKGVRTISYLFNITRIYNTVSAVSFIRRAFAFTKAYSEQREAFGKKIGQQPLHQRTLREMEIAYQSNTLLALFLSQLLGKEECDEASENEKSLLRFMTPVSKLYTAKQAIVYTSELVESFGGIGYLEDSGIPVLLRDAQVLSIWEGTTNVLSLDMIRAAQKENGLVAFIEFVDQRLANAKESDETKILKEKASILFSKIKEAVENSTIETISRDVAFLVAELAIAVLWIDFIAKNPSKSKYERALSYWVNQKINLKTLEITNDLDVK